MFKQVVRQGKNKQINLVNIKMPGWFNKKQKGFALAQLIIGIGIMILLAGMLYLWVSNTLQSGGLSKKSATLSESSEGQVEKFSEISPETSKAEEQESSKSEEKSEEKLPVLETPKEEPKIKSEKPLEYQRQDISFLKFVSSENCIYFLNSDEIKELKKLNVNGIRICPLYSISADGDLKEDVPEFLIVGLIRKAHQAGLAVFLEVNFGGPPGEGEFGGFPYLTEPIFVEKIYNAASHWAKVAEKENVEFYSPLNEPNLVFADKNLVSHWIEKSQNLRSLFSGNLVLKLADIGPENIGDISGYDYLAFDIMWGDARYDELRNHLSIAVNKANKLKEKYNLKGFFFGELGAERSMVSKGVQAEIFKTIFQETWGKVDGYCFLGWSNLEFKFKDNKAAKEIIKNWYKK